MIINVDRFTKGVVNKATPFSIQINVPDDLNLIKNISMSEEMVQKVNNKNEPLYKMEETGETVESRNVTQWEEKNQIIKYRNKDGSNKEESIMVKVPTEWTYNEPVMVTKRVDKIVSFLDNPELFMIDDVVTAKYRNILEKSICDYIIAYEFIDQNIDIKYENHAANTGIGFIQLLPKGQAKTNEIQLDEANNLFEILSYEGDEAVEIYINDVKIKNKKVILSNKTDKISVIFKNPYDKPLTVKAYSIGY